MGAEPSTARGRRTRERIVSAAVEAVAEHGAQGASLDDVGARAAASRSQLYHYFGDKNDLLKAVAVATGDAVLGAQHDLFADLGSWQGLRRWTDALVTAQHERGATGGCPLANLLGQLGERDDDIRSVLSADFDRWESAIRDGLADMARTGQLRADADVAWLARSTLASLQGGLVLAQAHRDPRALRQALDGALALIAQHRQAGPPSVLPARTAAPSDGTAGGWVG